MGNKASGKGTLVLGSYWATQDCIQTANQVDSHIVMSHTIQVDIHVMVEIATGKRQHEGIAKNKVVLPPSAIV